MNSNFSLAELKFLEQLRSSRRVVVTTHEHPDPDGLCSQLALAIALERMGKEVVMINASSTPKLFSYIPEVKRIKRHTTSLILETRGIDLAVAVDANEVKRVGSWFAGFSRYFCLDHHVKGSDAMPGIIREHYNSAAELVYEVIKGLGVEIDELLANILYIGIVSDTRGFRFIKENPDVLLVAHDLIKRGARIEYTYNILLSSYPRAFVELLNIYMESLHFSGEDMLAWAIMDEQKILNLGLELAITQELHPFALMLDTVKVSLIYKSKKGGRYRLSLRSKESYDVGSIARQLGGGGHRNAAGCDCTTAPFDNVKFILQQLRADDQG